MFDVGTLGGTDTLWAQLLQKNGQLSGWQQFTVTAPVARVPTLTVKNDANATRGQGINLSTLVSITDPDGVGYQKLELWDSNGTVAGGQFVVNGQAQTGGHEIDVAPANVGGTVFDVGTLGGTDTLLAQLLLKNGQLSGWQQFTVTAPIARVPTLTVASRFDATRGTAIRLSSLLSILDSDHVGYAQLELWDSQGNTFDGQLVVNGTPQTGGHEIDLAPSDLTDTVFNVGMLGGSDTLWARLQEGDGSLTAWQQFTVTAPTYYFKALDPSPSNGTLTSGINGLGQVVGYFSDSNGVHGFLYSGGAYSTLDDPLGINGTSAYAINDAGQVVGAYSEGGNGTTHGFLYSNGVYTTFDVPGSEWTEVYGINNAGEIVGQYQDGSRHQQGFLYSNGTYTTLEDPSATVSGTLPTGINNTGEVVGFYDDGNGDHAFLYSGGTYTTIDDPLGKSTVAYGINDAGQIVGYYTDNNNRNHGFLYSGGGYTTIDSPVTGTLDTFATGINDGGHIVGW